MQGSKYGLRLDILSSMHKATSVSDSERFLLSADDALLMAAFRVTKKDLSLIIELSVTLNGEKFYQLSLNRHLIKCTENTIARNSDGNIEILSRSRN